MCRERSGSTCTATSARSRSLHAGRGALRPAGSKRRRRRWSCSPRAWRRPTACALEVTGNAAEIARILGRTSRRSSSSAHRHRDQPRARQDRPPRRAHAGQAAGRRRARRGLDARRVDARDAPTAVATQPARARAHARQERDPRRADPPAEGPPAGQRPVRRPRSPWLAELRAARGRARDDRRRACATSTSSTARSPSLTGRSRARRSRHPTCCG